MNPLNKIPRRKPEDTGREHRPAWHGESGKAQRPGVPRIPSGAFISNEDGSCMVIICAFSPVTGGAKSEEVSQ